MIYPVENGQKLNELYSSDDSATIFTQAKQGAKLCTSYCVTTHRNTSHSNEHVTMPLGVISVNWEPIGFTLSKEAAAEYTTANDFGLSHGPLCLPDVAPIIFYGPECQVLNAPFTVKVLKCPSPKVGIPFRVTYQVKNKTSKSQTLLYSLSETPITNDGVAFLHTEELLIHGKVQGEVQISPFEEKSFPFTFMSMNAGKVHCPGFRVSSIRHQSLVINESATKDRYFFVMP